MYQEMKKLSNGIEIPVLALGTWFIDDDKVTEAVKSAVNMGYRHIDTAQAYGNEHMEILKHVEKIKDYGKHSIFPVFGGKM